MKITLEKETEMDFDSASQNVGKMKVWHWIRVHKDNGVKTFQKCYSDLEVAEKVYNGVLELYASNASIEPTVELIKSANVPENVNH